jgi:signal transduction histidine kinase
LNRPRESETTPAAPLEVARLDDAGRVCGRMAHDLDNLLMGLMGFAELARAETANGTRVASFLDELMTVAQNGREITRQLHAFGRAGRANPLPTSVAEIVRDATLPGGVATEIPVDLPKVAISAESLRLIIEHLVHNAAESKPESSRVRISGRPVAVTERLDDTIPAPVEPGNYVEISVKDDGAGIPAEITHRVGREPFITTKHRHRGLGLPTVFRTVHAHGGAVRIESSPRGTAVVVYLPSAGLPSRAPHQLPARPAPLEVASP